MPAIFRIGCLTFSFLVFSVSSAFACSCGDLSPEQSKEVIEKAIYIGLVKTIDKKFINADEVIYTLEPIWAYKGDPSQKSIIVYDLGWNSCAHSPAEEGIISEVVLISRNDKAYFGSICDHNLDWESIKQQAGAKPEKFLLIEKQCFEQGGKEFIFSHHEGQCIYPPIDDAHRMCISATECEGPYTTELSPNELDKE